MRGLSLGALFAIVFALCADRAKAADTFVRQASWHKTQKVFALAQTKDGFLWSGTDSGLLRFDGRNFRTFAADKQNGLRGNIVRALTVDNEGTLWIGLDEGEGLAKLQRGRISQIDTGKWLSGHDVHALCVDRDGTLWIGTSVGLIHFDPKKPGEATVVTAAGSGAIHALALNAKDGSLWIGGDAGLFKSTSKGVEAMGSFGSVLALLASPAGSIWVSDAKLGVVEIRENQPDHVAITAQGEGQQVKTFTALALDSNGDLWVGWNWGYGRLLHNELSPTFNTALPTVALLSDSEGGVWAGSYWGIVLRTTVPRVSTKTYTGVGEVPIIFGVAAGKAEDIWLTQVRSLVHVQGDNIHRYESGAELPSWCPRSVWPAGGGGVWLGTCDQGLIRVSDAGVEHLGAKTTPRLKNIQNLFEDAAGVLWLATVPGELYKMKGGVADLVPFTNGYCDPSPNERLAVPRVDDECAYSITAMVPAQKGGLWIAIRRNGLRRVWPGGEEVFSKKDGLATNDLISLHEDSDGTLWIGTQGHGLIRLKDGHFDNLQREDGLLAQSIHGITADSLGNLWMSSESGISRQSKSNVDDFLAKRVPALSGAGYGVPDGLASPVTVQSFSSPITLLSDGRLLVPLDQGLGILETRTIDGTKGFANVVLESTRINGESRSPKQALRFDLPAGSNRLGSLEFGFSLPNFEVPHRVDVAYRLFPLEQEFRLAQGERNVRYFDLPPGSYTFEMQPRLDGAAWGSITRSESVHLASFYRRPSFFGLLILSLVPLFALYYIIRLRYQQERINSVLDERNRIARELHDTLAQYFTGISYQLARLSLTLNEDPKASDEINEVTKIMLAQCRLEARQAIHNLRSEDFGPQGIFETMKMLADETRLSGDVNVEFATLGQDAALDEGVRRQLIRIAQEAIVNALTHAQASCITINLETTDKTLMLSIADDGEGFDLQTVQGEKPMHFGLQGISERAASIGGDLDMNSSPGGGTQVRVSVPLSAKSQVAQG
jgi:signal transduction histidine kinase/ligand-binding sensor domain-containing protein